MNKDFKITAAPYERDMTQKKYAIPESMRGHKDPETFWFMVIYVVTLFLGLSIAILAIIIRGRFTP
jgi:hypothetical protein